MRFVIQIVDKAQVSVDGSVCGSIKQGYCIFAGVGSGDTKETADKMVRKMLGLRIFKDDEGKINRSIRDVEGEILMISQFTLYADSRKGNRPNFINCAPPDEASALFDYTVEKIREEIPRVETGVFGAHMSVALTNDGPFTIILDSADLK